MKRLLVITALTGALLGIVVPPVSGSHGWQVQWLPPVGPMNPSSHNDKAYVSSDWHSSQLSGDPDRNRECTPYRHQGGWACTGIDWTDGPAGAGSPENIYFRVHALTEWPTVNSAIVRFGPSTPSGCTSSVAISIVSGDTGLVVGEGQFQHIRRIGWNDDAPGGATPMEVAPLMFSPEGAGQINEYRIGQSKQDGSACWAGYHVHEDENMLVYPQNWRPTVGTYDNSTGEWFEVDDAESVTRVLSFGPHPPDL